MILFLISQWKLCEDPREISNEGSQRMSICCVKCAKLSLNYPSDLLNWSTVHLNFSI